MFKQVFDYVKIKRARKQKINRPEFLFLRASLQIQEGRPNKKPKFQGLNWQIANRDPRKLVAYSAIFTVSGKVCVDA